MKVIAILRSNKIDLSRYYCDHWYSERKGKWVIECCDNYGKYNVYATKLIINGVEQ